VFEDSDISVSLEDCGLFVPSGPPGPRFPLQTTGLGDTPGMPKVAGDPYAPGTRAILRRLRDTWPKWTTTDELGIPEEVRPHLDALYNAELIERQPARDHFRWREVH